MGKHLLAFFWPPFRLLSVDVIFYIYLFLFFFKYIFLIKLIKKPCTCLGYEFCFQQHDNVTRQSYFFKPSSIYLLFLIQAASIFLWEQFYVYFRGDLQYSFITLHKNLNFVSS